MTTGGYAAGMTLITASLAAAAFAFAPPDVVPATRIEPPPAATVWMSSIGAVRRTPATVRSLERSKVPA